MSFWSFMFDSDISQRVDISHLQETATTDRVTLMDLEKRVRVLEEDLARVVLINEAFVRTLKARGLCDDAELKALVDAIDGEDGKVDGRMSPTAVAPGFCPQCGRPRASRGRHCYYCGAGG